MLTDRGRWILALGGGIYLAAWAFGSEPLYPVAIGLVLAVVAAALWVRLLRAPDARSAATSAGRAPGRRRRPRRGSSSTSRAGRRPARSSSRADRAARRARDAARAPARPACAGATSLRRVPRGRYPIEEAEVVIEDPFGLERVVGRSFRPAPRSSSIRASSTSTGSSRSPARARPRGGACSCAARPASTSTAFASTSRGSRCAASTGRRPPSAGS